MRIAHLNLDTSLLKEKFLPEVCFFQQIFTRILKSYENYLFEYDDHFNKPKFFTELYPYQRRILYSVKNFVFIETDRILVKFSSDEHNSITICYF